MSDFIHAREFLREGDLFVLNCDTQCNFFILDDLNFQRYRRGERYQYYGGFYQRFPAKIAAPYDDNWNAVLDLGGGRANIRYAFSTVKR